MCFLTNPGKKCSFMQLWKVLLVSSVLVAIFCHCGEHSTAQFLLVIIICRQLVPADMFEGRQHQLAAEVLAGSGICFMFMIHDWMFFSPLQKILLLTECKYEDKLCSPNIGNEMHSFFRHSVAIDASCHYWFVHVCAHAPCKANSITVTQLLQSNHLHLGSWLPWTGHPKGSHRAVDTQKRCPMHRSHQVFCKKWHLFGVCSGSKHLWYLKRSLPGSPKNCHVSHHLGPSSLDYQTYLDSVRLCNGAWALAGVSGSWSPKPPPSAKALSVFASPGIKHWKRLSALQQVANAFRCGNAPLVRMEHCLKQVPRYNSSSFKQAPGVCGHRFFPSRVPATSYPWHGIKDGELKIDSMAFWLSWHLCFPLLSNGSQMWAAHLTGFSPAERMEHFA